jgi:arylsulfatase A
MKQLRSLKLDQNTIVILTSDNGPVLDDGYEDGAVTQLNGHTPWGPLRGGKYSTFEAGTRVPLILSWPGKVKAGLVSDAMISQVDLLGTMSALVKIKLSKEELKDSQDQLTAWTGKSATGRTLMFKQGLRTLSVTKGYWKYIEPSDGPAMNKLTNTELGNNPLAQLYHLGKDIGERNNVAEQHPEVVAELSALLKKSRQ